MKLTEANFQMVVKCGGIALVLSAVISVWVVLKYRETYRDRQQSDQRFQQLALQQQALQGLLQDCLVRAKSDPKVLEILQRNQLIGTSSNNVGKEQGIRP